jgi:Icc-related predicted phosphoesterase
MRILLVSDLHYSLKQFDWVVARADEFDAVVLAGDHLDIRSYVEPDAQIAVVLEYLRRIASKTTVVACSGNHDLNARNELGERAALWLDDARMANAYVDGSSLTNDDVYLTVCPWWDGPRTRVRVDAFLTDEAKRVDGRRWVWVYHAPPDASPTSWTGKRYYGDADLNAWIAQHQPALVLCGHVHESPFVDGGGWVAQVGATWVLNAGHEPGPRPAHVVIDIDAAQCTWSASLGTAEVSLEGQYSG